jgi:hypothetical protein
MEETRCFFLRFFCGSVREVTRWFFCGYGGGVGVVLVLPIGVFLCFCSKGGVVLRNYLPPSGAVGSNQ